MRKKLKKILNENNIFMDLQAETKEDLIIEMIDRLALAGSIRDKDSALQAVMARELKMSTGMEKGIAIPHGKTDTAERLTVAVGRKKKGIDFNSLDGKPAHIFIMTISPESHSGPHLQFLAEIGRLLKDSQARKAILEAESTEDILKILV